MQAGDPVLPPEIATSLRGLVGLDDLPAYRPLVQLMDGTIGLSPQDFATIYGAVPLQASGLTGAGRSIAVVARSNFEDGDITGFADLFDVQLNPVRKLADPRDDPGVLRDEGEETEVLLDTQWAGALAPGAQLNVVIATPEGNIPEALERAVTGREGDVITISFGLCEPFAPVIAAELFDAFYAIANAQGQTVLVASGDGGATECEPGDDGLAVNALASSPHAIAVGGTSLDLAADGSLPGTVAERVWADEFGGGGGGESTIFARPRYQLGGGLPVEIGGRLMPDLAVAAGPETPGYVIFEDGRPLVIGGTSAGAPRARKRPRTGERAAGRYRGPAGARTRPSEPLPPRGRAGAWAASARLPRRRDGEQRPAGRGGVSGDARVRPGEWLGRADPACARRRAGGATPLRAGDRARRRLRGPITRAQAQGVRGLLAPRPHHADAPPGRAEPPSALP